MSAAVVIAIVGIVVAAAVFVYATSARRDRAAALGLREAKRKDRGREAIDQLEAEERQGLSSRDVEREAHEEARGTAIVKAPTAAPPAPRAPMDPEVLGVTRRQFFNRGIIGLFGVGLAGFGAASIGFLWPSLSGGFGSKIRAGSLEDILAEIADKKEPFYVPEGRFYITPYPKDALGKAKAAYSGGVLEGMEAGVVALYQKCVHLGCRVPWCSTSQWFECPCHGSQYNRVGEKRGGPAPRGLDRFPASVDGGVVVVDTGQIVQGPPLGVNTTGQEAEGPHCT